MKNCATCYYSAERNGILFCMGRKNMPFVRGWESCNAWEERNGMFEPQTNADRIRAMSDEKLAWFMAINIGCDECRFFATCQSAPQDKACPEKWLDWLKQEEEE